MRLLRSAGRPDWAEPVIDRLKQVLWVLDYLDDLDADFLAIYGIDLERDEISARRYFALVHRLTAYQGVMAALVEHERQEQGGPPAKEPHRPAPAAQQQDSDVREVSLTAFRMQFPGLVSMGEG